MMLPEPAGLNMIRQRMHLGPALLIYLSWKECLASWACSPVVSAWLIEPEPEMKYVHDVHYVLIWFGLWSRYGFGYGFDMFGYGFDLGLGKPFFSVPDGLALRKETQTAPGQVLGRFLAGLYGVDIILI